MTTREALHALVEALSEEELEVLWADLSAVSHPSSPESEPGPAVIDARKHPALAAIWDNDDDTIFDTL